MGLVFESNLFFSSSVGGVFAADVFVNFLNEIFLMKKEVKRAAFERKGALEGDWSSLSIFANRSYSVKIRLQGYSSGGGAPQIKDISTPKSLLMPFGGLFWPVQTGWLCVASTFLVSAVSAPSFVLFFVSESLSSGGGPGKQQTLLASLLGWATGGSEEVDIFWSWAFSLMLISVFSGGGQLSGGGGAKREVSKLPEVFWAFPRPKASRKKSKV